MKPAIHSKICPENASDQIAKSSQNQDTLNWICYQYFKTKESKLNKFIMIMKSIIFNSSTYLLDPYTDPEFIVIESLPEIQVKLLIEQFIDEEKNSFAYNDISKYIRKYWSKEKMSIYVGEIIGYLMDLPDISKYWFFEFYPLMGDIGKSQIINLVSNYKLEGYTDELLYGIYLMEPENLWEFYPKFLLAVDSSGSFNLWVQYWANFKIIDKLYANGYNIFTCDMLAEYWSIPYNMESATMIKNKLKLLY